jgi:hypothetical protein
MRCRPGIQFSLQHAAATVSRISGASLRAAIGVEDARERAYGVRDT